MEEGNKLRKLLTKKEQAKYKSKKIKYGASSETDALTTVCPLGRRRNYGINLSISLGTDLTNLTLFRTAFYLFSVLGC